MIKATQMIKETIKLISSLLEYFKHMNLQKEQELKRKDVRMIRAYLNSSNFAESQGLPLVADYCKNKADIIYKTSK